jgi:hypothetical protein
VAISPRHCIIAKIALYSVSGCRVGELDNYLPSSDSVTEKDRDRAGLCEGAANTEEETCSNCTTEGDELDVS